MFWAPQPPPDPSRVAVYVDKQIVLQDAANGWVFGATTSTVVLTGSYCDKVLTAESVRIDVIYGCGPSPKGMLP